MENHQIKQRVADVCQNIKRCRIAKGYSQAFLADKAGIGVNSLRRIERCETNLTVEKLMDIADALDMDVRDLLKKNG